MNATPSRRITVKNTAIAAAAALVTDLVVYAIAKGVGVTMEVNTPYPITAVTVGLLTALPLLLAALVVALIAAKKPRFQTFAAWIGLVVALLSVANPFISATQISTAFSLAPMHIVVGAAWFLLARPTPTS
ncbi:DUF6069 family protein [Streptomyces sp. NPDC057565]|uniref:DUF6069 family protein n=1 Tax=Streptomyces sp. NPDC057565 TaxID=3346169 RepID=UPI0036992F3E